ncbi:hypothetical protein [Maricaulis sp.]|uniref:hypothetical protein n=1 Tax=Maricaulis sp. TaxID=1486257 RepID=UPI003A932BF8
MLDLITYIAMLGSGVAVLFFPAVSGLLSFHPYAAAPVAVLLAINVLVLGMAATAIRFKGGSAWWRVYILGAANVAVWLIAALDVSLVWQVIAQERWDRVWLTALILPAISLAWVGIVLSSDRKVEIDSGAVIDAVLHPEPELEPVAQRAPKPMLQRLGSLAIYTARFAIIALCVVQFFILAAGLVLSIYGAFLALLFEDQVVAPHRMGEVLAQIGSGLIERYLAIALPVARTTVTYAVGFVVFIAAVIVPIAAGIGQGMKLLNQKRAALPQASRAWIESSAREMMEWVSTRPHKRLGGLVTTLIIILTTTLGWAILALPSWLLADWLNGVIFPADTELFREQPGGFGIVAGGIIGFFVFIFLGMAGTQLMPGLRGYWASHNRARMERQPGLMLQETLAGLDSAASKGWYSMTVPFDPEAFLRRWLGRNVNLAKTVLLVSLPIILALTAVDAFWFRSWGEDALRQSGPFEFTVHERPYANALRVETSCYVIDTEDDGAQANVGYLIVYDEAHRFRLLRQLSPVQIERAAVIDRALRTAGVPIVETIARQQDGPDRAACYALLRGRFGEDVTRLQAILTGSPP